MRFGVFPAAMLAASLVVGAAAAAEIMIDKEAGAGGWKTGSTAGGACAALLPIEEGRGVAALFGAGGGLTLIVGAGGLPDDNPDIKTVTIAFGENDTRPETVTSLSPGYFAFQWKSGDFSDEAVEKASRIEVRMTSQSRAYGVGFAVSELTSALDRITACPPSSKGADSGSKAGLADYIAWLDRAIGSYPAVAADTGEDVEEDQLLFEEEGSDSAALTLVSAPGYDRTLRPDTALPFFVARAMPSGEGADTGAETGKDETGKDDTGKDKATGAETKPMTEEEKAKEKAKMALHRQIQRELQRVNCYHGGIDGKWGPGSQGALVAYLDAGGEGGAILDGELLAGLRGTREKVCEDPTCRAGQVLRGGRCVASAPEKTDEASGSSSGGSTLFRTKPPVGLKTDR